jgi:DNA mismatch repair protein MutH
MQLNRPYDHTDPHSIEMYAQKLLGHSLKEVLGDEIRQVYKGKGKLGQILEDLYFQYKPNSDAAPDFAEAGVELKTNPIKRTNKGLRSKERLVFNIIDYLSEPDRTFYESSFWKKNKLILLMMFLHEDGLSDLDYIFKIIRLFEFPPEDLKIIKDDWETIVAKIRAGRAHELSEGDTLYLGACTKGANRESVRSQYIGDIPAKQRAYSLKSKYLNFIIEQGIQHAESVVKQTSEYVGTHQTFENLVIEKFRPYYGMSDENIARALNVHLSSAKNKNEILCRAILGVKTKKSLSLKKQTLFLRP